MRLLRKNAIITGCSRGLGSVIASALFKEGAALLLVARSEQELLNVRELLLKNGPKGAEVHVMAVDLADQSSAQQIISRARQIWSRVDILINNAGMLGPIGMIADNDWALWRTTMQVNFLAPAELCHLAIRWMLETGTAGSIINLSGGGAASPRPRFSAYGTSKCALVRFTETIAAEVDSSKIRVNCIAPGAMKTEMLQQTLELGPERVGEEEYQRIVNFSSSGGADPQDAAQLAVYLASAESAGITGRLISAVWDPWKQLHKHAGEIQKSDIYTLRRITPEDRGKAWANV